MQAHRLGLEAVTFAWCFFFFFLVEVLGIPRLEDSVKMLPRPQLVLYLDAHLLRFIGCFPSSLVSWMPIFFFAVGVGAGKGDSVSLCML